MAMPMLDMLAEQAQGLPPVTTKNSSLQQNSKYVVGCSSMQGRGATMDDTYFSQISLPDDPEAAFFGVYDGHGGDVVSRNLSENLHNYITSQEAYKAGKIKEAIKDGFLALDTAMAQEGDKFIDSGSTAVVIIIKGKTLYCANVGDCKAVACVGGQTVPLNKKHKPKLENEKKRILAAGGILNEGRINGYINISRSFGDFTYKCNADKTPEEQILIALPEVTCHEIAENWDFIVLSTHGLWDVMKEEKVIKYLKNKFNQAAQDEQTTYYPDKICEDLLDHCIDPTGGKSPGLLSALASPFKMQKVCYDNLCVILVCLLHGKTYRQMCQWHRKP